MNWKEQLSILEKNKQWDEAITFMEDVIKHNPDNMDAHIFMNYLLMNLLVEEDYNMLKHEYWAALAKQYFEKSFRKFHTNPEYLFFTGITAVMSPWYFGIEMKDYDDMIKTATIKDPKNDLYRISHYFGYIHSKQPNISQALHFADILLDPDSSVQKQLAANGAIGGYYLELMTGTAKEIILDNIEYYLTKLKHSNTMQSQHINSLTILVNNLFKNIKNCKRIEYAEQYLKALDLIQQYAKHVIRTTDVTLSIELIDLAKNYNHIYQSREFYYEKIRNKN